MFSIGNDLWQHFSVRAENSVKIHIPSPKHQKLLHKHGTTLPTKYCNPSEWWKNNEKNYPILVALARTMYVAIQETSAPSEHVFSVASRLISNLDPELASMMFSVSENHEWFRKEMENTVVIE
jgi:hypothetical protein